MSDVTPDSFDLSIIRRRPWMKWALIILAWTAFGLLIAGESYFRSRLTGGSLSLGHALTWYFAYSSTWALFTPVALWLRWRFRFDSQHWPRSLAIHLTASLLISWAGSLVYVGAGQLLGRIPAGIEVLVGRSLMTFVVFLHFDPFLYWIIIGLSYAFQHYRESRERELKAAQLETQLVEARLQALEMQLHPHFLFNALNTIAVLVRTKKNAQAVRVVTGLGELLRRALDGAGVEVVPLKQELAFVERYLEIEQIRFGDRLKVEMAIAPETLDARVPYLILQPLVENAIQHGIAPTASAELLRISAHREGDLLQLEVLDDGPGLPDSFEDASNGNVGLATTSERLQHMYGDAHSFAVRNAEGGGVAASLSIPFQLAPDELQLQA